MICFCILLQFIIECAIISTYFILNLIVGYSALVSIKGDPENEGKAVG